MLRREMYEVGPSGTHRWFAGNRGIGHCHQPHWIINFFRGIHGVDIFFVTSVFLITPIIAREINENRFTLSRFTNAEITAFFLHLL
jgi:peptidoglycan/LPS O-acetylase OafA/YrhL